MAAPARHEQPPPPEREVSDDSCSRDACAAVRGRLLPGGAHRHRRAEARALRGAVLRRRGGRQPPAPRQRQGQEAARPTINWELLEKRIARSAEAYQRPVIRKKIVELIEYYNQCAEAGEPAGDPGRRAAGGGAAPRVQRARRQPRARHPARPDRAGRPARARRPAPPARAAPARRDPAGRRRAGAGRDLRSPGARSGGRDVRHHQRQAHQAEPVAPDQPRGPAPLSRQGARDRPRHHPRALRRRELAAARRDQALRRRPRQGRAGAARRGAPQHLHLGAGARRPRRRPASSTTPSASS